jgi:hypothetical protein
MSSSDGGSAPLIDAELAREIVRHLNESYDDHEQELKITRRVLARAHRSSDTGQFLIYHRELSYLLRPGYREARLMALLRRRTRHRPCG